jgi:hypothetical protein
VRNGIKNAEQHWGKPFYVSEFNANGPWNMGKTPWGAELGEPVTKKVNDLKDCYAAIDASPLCLGSTVFVWGHYGTVHPAYFSLLLAPHPDDAKSTEAFDRKLFTPQADAMIEHFTGRPRQGNRAPALSKLEFDGGDKSKLAQPGEPMSLHLAADDADGDKVAFVTWILGPKVRNSKFIAGPTSQPSGEEAVVTAPKVPGEYVILVYAIDNRGGGSAGILPIKVPEASPAP